MLYVTWPFPILGVQMIIAGWKTRVSRASPREVLPGACPGCRSDLILSDLKKWFTLYFIPLFPFSHVDTFFHCKTCKSSYKQSIRDAVHGRGQQNSAAMQGQMQRLFASTMAACMTHMAKIDGHISPEEMDEIRAVGHKFPQFQNDIGQAVQRVAGSNDDNHVYQMLQQCTEVLTADGTMVLISQVAKVLLADGRIDPNEERLMRQYMQICQIPQELYRDILSRVNRANQFIS